MFNASAAPNSVICVSSAPHLPSISSQLVFPMPAWKPEPTQEMVFVVGQRETELDQRAKQLDQREGESL
jgi:hypothetical protein